MSSHSGLSETHRSLARQRALQAAVLALNHAPSVHYTQGQRRWEGIDQALHSHQGHYPNYCDCSSFFTWCLWNGLHVACGVEHDIVNNAGWRGGYTGTLLATGKVVHSERNIKVGDAIVYGPGTGEHVALAIGGGHVISHGSEGGPYKLAVHYRSDGIRIRRFV